jgi:hypothetical protein
VINAATGVPIVFTRGAPGQTPDISITCQLSRVTFADGAAGEF